MHACVCDVPEVALVGLDEADAGVLLVGVHGAEGRVLTGNVLKLHTHRHRLGVRVHGRRHGALNGVCCLAGIHAWTRTKTAT